MNDLSSMSPQEIKAAEKQLYEEYKQKVAQLKKVQKEKEAVGHILSLGPSNGNDIAHKIGERTGGLWIPSTGGIYPLLKKLEKQDLIIGEWDDLDKKFQKIYTLTPAGMLEFENKKQLLRPKIEEALKVFKIIYRDIY